MEKFVAQVHTQISLAEALIKRLQLIAMSLIMRSNFQPCMGTCHFARRSTHSDKTKCIHKYFPLQLAFGREPNISLLKIFGCAMYVPVQPPQRTTMVGNIYWL